MRLKLYPILAILILAGVGYIHQFEINMKFVTDYFTSAPAIFIIVGLTFAFLMIIFGDLFQLVIPYFQEAVVKKMSPANSHENNRRRLLFESLSNNAVSAGAVLSLIGLIATIHFFEGDVPKMIANLSTCTIGIVYGLAGSIFALIFSSLYRKLAGDNKPENKYMRTGEFLTIITTLSFIVAVALCFYTSL